MKGCLFQTTIVYGRKTFLESNGQFGSVSLDDTPKFTISQAGNPWDAQVWQDLTPMQIDGLTMGGTWELSFKAMSPDGAKTFHVFLGENGGSWDRYWAADGDGLVNIDGDWKTYTLTTEVDRSWENMKLGFEVGADVNDLQIDDVVLKHVPAVHENIVNNGDFSDGDSLWTIDGGNGTVTFDDSLKFVVETAGNPWDLQAYQAAISTTNCGISTGRDWQLTFDAMSPDGAKKVSMFSWVKSVAVGSLLGW